MIPGLYTTANLDSDTGVLQVGRYDSKGWTVWIPKEYMEREIDERIYTVNVG